MKSKLELLIIDPQNDFCDPNGALFVNGADEDSKRLADMVLRLVDKWNDIHVTLDSHHYVDIAHPIFWKDSDGNNPQPFTIITAQEVENGAWRPTNPGWKNRCIDYVRHLESNGRYALCIWPPHCLIGSWGYGIMPVVFDSLTEWTKRFKQVDMVTKGSNIFTEHYSAVQADVPDPQDDTTMLNTSLVQTLQGADMIAITGQALSHCVANTVRDIANNFGDENVKKLVLIEDTTSPVPGFEDLADDFVREMKSRGMQTAKAADFL